MISASWTIARRGETLAAPELGHSVHVDVTGLEPDRWYYYRFIAGGEASPTGRTRRHFRHAGLAFADPAPLAQE